MIKKNTFSCNIPLILMAVVCLTLKCACFILWQKILFPHDLPLILLSIVYYIFLGVLCFLCGKSTTTSVILASILTLEILVPFVTILFESPFFIFLFRIIGCSGYALLELVHTFEGVGQTISDWYYLAAVAIGQLLFMGIILVGRRIWTKRKH